MARSMIIYEHHYVKFKSIGFNLYSLDIFSSFTSMIFLYVKEHQRGMSKMLPPKPLKLKISSEKM